jgi:hypothetical protein
MRRVSLALALAIVGCGQHTDVSRARVVRPGDDRVAYQLQGAIDAPREFTATAGALSETAGTTSDAWGGSRIGCSLVNASDAAPARGKVVLISAVENFGEEHGAGIYLKVTDFVGVGRYALSDGGRAWVFDRGHIQACARVGDRSCYQGADGCQVTVTRWDFTPGVAERPPGYPESVGVGLAEGTFECRTLGNEVTGETVSVVDGTFRCHAYDWSSAQ